MLKGVVVHIIAGVLASSSGLFALGWVFTDYENPYGYFVMAAGRATAWSAILYIVLGFVLYAAAFRARRATDSDPRVPPFLLGWLVQLVGACFALASSAYAAASARRGPGGDFRQLGYIYLGVAALCFVTGIVIQGWSWKTRGRAQD